MGSPRLALVGTFVLGGLLLFAVGLFLIGDRRLLFTERFEIEADFGNVTGVIVGTSVRLSGLEAGEVLGIELPLNPGDRFSVRMRVREELRPLVRTDSVAALLTDGLLGSVFVQIRAGSDAAPPVADGGSIRGVDAIEIADLIEEGRDTFRLIATEFLLLRQQMADTFVTLGETVESTTRLINDAGEDVRRVTGASAQFMDDALVVLRDTRTLVGEISAGQGTVGKLLTDDALYQHLAGSMREAEATMRAVRGSAEEVERLVGRIGGPEGEATRLLTDASEAMTYARAAMADLAENTEALKRNWLFRGFFSERGFYNLDELSLDEYRELQRDNRYTPLRVWVASDVLFEPGPGEELTLRDDAARRLDEAMGELVAYPRDTPLVVEGYATGGDRGSEFLRAQSRADLVRRYLARTFRREATLTGIMPMGAEAVGSPSGDGRWDGVALTLFVNTKQLRAGGLQVTEP